MLQLDSWLEVIPADGDTPAVRVKLRPIGRAAARDARDAALASAGIAETDAALYNDRVAMALIRACLIDWQGVGDADGVPVAVSPETVAAFLDHPGVLERLTEAFVAPWLARELEKNGFAGSPNGISTRVTPAPTTAASPAGATKKARAGKTKTAKPARTDAII